MTTIDNNGNNRLDSHKIGIPFLNQERFEVVLAPVLLGVFCIYSKQNPFDANIFTKYIKYSPEVVPDEKKKLFM